MEHAEKAGPSRFHGVAVAVSPRGDAGGLPGGSAELGREEVEVPAVGLGAPPKPQSVGPDPKGMRGHWDSQALALHIKEAMRLSGLLVWKPGAEGCGPVWNGE